MAEGGVTEVVADVVETAGEDLIEAAEVARRFVFSPASFGIGLAVGAGVSFLVTKKLLQTKYEKLAEDEITQMREHFRLKDIVAEPKPDLDQVVQDLGYAAERKVVEEIVRDEVKNTVTNVFTSTTPVPDDQDYRGLSTDVWNYDRELANRSPDKPYIIHKDEFMQGRFDGEEHEQTTLTYFIQDDVLVDERDQQRPEIDELVGLENIEKFGHGSEDANVLYVRNDKIRMDFEILRDGGSYAATVHGILDSDQIQHSAMRRRARGRDDD